MRFSHIIGTIGLLLCLALTPSHSVAESKYQPLKLFSQVMDIVEDSYVQKVNRKELIQGAIQGMLSNLDPHSAYLNKEAFDQMQVETSGEFSGIGIEITTRKGRLTVVSPIEGTPAQKAGLKSGDIILKINGNSTQDTSLMDAVHKIRGKKGTKVDLTILHKNAKSPEKVTIKRDVIPVHSVESQFLKKGYLYVRITNFNKNTNKELLDCLNGHRSNLKGLVLDLRNNPGGLLSQAVTVADTFLSKGKIVYTKAREQKAQMSRSAQKQKFDLLNVPMVVLINAGSASASEIVAGALQDQQRALVVGVRSFGKGSVQTVIPLKNGSGIKLTTARYYTPDGRSIQAKGIVPDIKVPFVPPQSDRDKNQNPFSIYREQKLEGYLDRENTGNATGKNRSKEVQKMLKKDNQLRIALQLVQSLPTIQALNQFGSR